eukprot:TRINITY_DN7396_c0_g1_i1.p1 TRINITY_DN7396_c0_g1~~TRINITY_DN7396_c0_g1_i1.p1  ORF type:complete len:183 (-),score=21.24 TRINITY_DN7396_c0_g1_i1:56-604(-)
MSRATLFVIAILVGAAFSCSPCDGCCCCDIPANHQYYLTSFCESTDHESLACGGTCDTYRGQYFTADRQRFGCGKTLTICHPPNATATDGTVKGDYACLRATVRDAGPGQSVEQRANHPIIDASVNVCQQLAGQSSCGWSDRVLISAVLTFENDGGYPNDRVFYLSPAEYQAMMIRNAPLNN